MKWPWRWVQQRAGLVVRFGARQVATVSRLWRTSLQFKVTASTLALCSAVVFVLIMVLQYQIVDQLVETKRRAAIAQTHSVLAAAQTELASADANPDRLKLKDALDKARKAITSSSPAASDEQGQAAGTFEPVLASSGSEAAPGAPNQDATVSSGAYDKVPTELRRFVEENQMAAQISTPSDTTYLIVGAPVASTVPSTQLYLLFPMTAEQNTADSIQRIFLVGGLVLLVLVAGIANLVTRQVVMPVRRAAQAAGRFGEGNFDERLVATGSDDLAKLANSYNEMADSIRAQIQQLEEFGQLQRRFTSDVSHELRTPLTTVRMAADVLHASREAFPPGLARSTELLVDELDRFEALLGDLLEISRLDAGVEELVAERIDIRPIVERAADQVKVLAGTTGSAIELRMPDSVADADIDARRVERILRNLLANAVDHGEGMPVEVTVGVNDTCVAVTVRDYGVGLRPGEADLVFNRFWRADPSRNRRTGGTGLGLAISQEDARLHGGDLVAWGEPGQGACFLLTLPREQGQNVVESPLSLPAEPTPEASPAPPENAHAPSTDAETAGQRPEEARR